MGLLTGKNIVITGVLTDASLAFGVAALAQQEGANLLLTGAGRALSLTQRTARKLPAPVPVVEFDVTVDEHVERVREDARAHFDGRVDGVLHSIGFAPEACLGDDFMAATWPDVAIAMQISAYSLKTLADAFAPLMGRGGAFVGLDFDNTVAWPAYNWMGVAKSALESVNRYLAKELGPRGIRSNLVAAGPIKTIAAKSIPGFKAFEDVWDVRAPLGWDVTDSTAVAKACVAMLSDWFPATTGSMIHVDGGYHAVGACARPSPASAVDDLLRRASTAPGTATGPLPSVVGRPPEGDRAEHLHVGRQAELVAQLLLATEDGEEQRTEPGVLSGEQQGHQRHRGVDGPIGRRPGLSARTEPCRPLVVLGVAPDVGLGVCARERDDRRPEQTRPGEAVPPLLRERMRPEPLGVRSFEHDEVPPLGLAGARGT